MCLLLFTAAFPAALLAFFKLACPVLFFYQKLMDWVLLLFPNIAWHAYGGIYHSVLTYIWIKKLEVTRVKLLVVKA